MPDGLKILFVFVDGLGLGSDDPAINPLADTQKFPNLGKLLKNSIPLDAALGVPGLPQSATGQAAGLIPKPHDIRLINKATGTVAIRTAAVPAALT